MNVWIAVQKHAGGLSRICDPSSNVQVHIPHCVQCKDCQSKESRKTRLSRLNVKWCLWHRCKHGRQKTKHKDLRPKQVKNLGWWCLTCLLNGHALPLAPDLHSFTHFYFIGRFRFLKLFSSQCKWTPTAVL